MKMYYSKPSIDIEKESLSRLQKDIELLKHQRSISETLLHSQQRSTCILCGEQLKGEHFNHREIPFVLCARCGHIQTRVQPPQGYPGVEFNAVYPKMDLEGFQDRKARIYKPKLDWILNCLEEIKFSRDQIINMTWVEMGAGAGYFLSCVQDIGVKQLEGFDAENSLVEIANSVIGGSKVKYYEGNLSDSFNYFHADIYVAFFVLEHINDTYCFFRKMSSLPRGSIFIFSVPVFGLTTILEGIFGNNYARNLDCVYHTQLYTDSSIKYGMMMAGFEIIAQWVFGQDAVDFTRFILNNSYEKFSGKFYKKIEEHLILLQDSFQHCIDKINLSDQRHVIAIKK